MTIDPFLQFQELLAALFCGLALGLLADTVKQLFVLLGVSPPAKSSVALYARPLPLIRRPVRRAPKGACQTAQEALCPSPRVAKAALRGQNATSVQDGKNARNAMGAQPAENAKDKPSEQNAQGERKANGMRAPRVTHIAHTALEAVCRVTYALLRGFFEFLLPVLAALSLLLVSFYYNRGDFRLSTVAVLMLGLFLWKGKLSCPLSRPLSLAVFLLAAAMLYLRVLLLLPLKATLWLLWRFCLLPLKHVLQGIHGAYCQKRSSALCTRQLAAAKNGFLIQSKRKEKRKCRKKTKKGAVAPLPSRL